MRYIDSGQRDPSQALGSWMQDLNSSAVAELRFQTGFFGITGFALLMPVIGRLRNEDGVTRCLIGSNDSGTGGEDVRKLVDALGLPRSAARLAVCAFGNAFFHPKVIHVRRKDGSQAAYVGSANLTESGVGGRHIEAGVLLDTADGDAGGELEKIAAAIDAWFNSDREGFYPVATLADVDRLVEEGILAEAAAIEGRTSSRRSSLGKAPKLPTLQSLLKLTPSQAGKLPMAAPPSLPTSATSALARVATSTPATSHYFMMELSKNRVSGSSYQADIGKSAFKEFFGGKIGGRVDVRVNTVTSTRTTKVVRDRQLVDVKSKNYRLEIDFPHTYPTSGRPVVTFRKVTAKEFDCLLLMPGDVGHSEALATLSSFAKPVAGNRMRRAVLSSAQLASTWPGCPLL